MRVTTSGTYRVLRSTRVPEELLLLDVETHNPTYVPIGTHADGDDSTPGDDEGTSASDERERADNGNVGRENERSDRTESEDDALRATIAALEPGNVIEATIEWEENLPRFVDLAVRSHTRIEFIDGATGIFEAALETWRDARTDGAAMNSRLTRSTNGEVNGVIYTFAEQSGQRDLFDEFRDGVLPLEPLLDRLEAGGVEPPYGVFVIRPADEPFVLVYLTLERDGLLARTVRETYD